MKFFDWDDAKNTKLRAERGIGFEDVVFHIERGDLLESFWNTQTPAVTPASGSSLSDAGTTCTSCRSSKTNSTRFFLKTFIRSWKATKQDPGERSVRR